MTLHSLRSTWTATVLGFISAALLTSCGGGGAAQGTTGGTLAISPATVTIYGGVPATFTLVGGRPAYQLSSSEPALLPVPSTTNSSSVTLLPANPGVIDAGITPPQLPVRTVTLTARDANGNTATSTVQVAQNFLTGYGASFSSSCPGASGATAPGFCAGGDTLMTFSAVNNGNLFGAREFRIEVVSGPITIINPATGVSGNSVGVTSDHNGSVQAIIRVAPNVSTQFAMIRIVDVATGASTQQAFTIVGGASTTLLTVLPSSFTFTGPDDATCGTGSGEFAVFDGQPPYTAIASDSNLSVQYVDPNHNPGLFIVRAFNPNVCITTGTVIITDAANARATVTVTTTKGSTPAAVPPTPLSVQPSSVTLGCAQSGSVLAVGGGSAAAGGGGGGTTYSASSSNPDITAVVNGNTVTITRAGPAGAGTGSSTSQVFVTDGSQVVPVTVTAPTTCP